MIERNLYQVLGVPRDASAETIHHAYRNLAKYWHPDLNPGNSEAEERFKEVAAAYEILCDPERRAQYDRDNPPPSEAHQGERAHYSPDVGSTAEEDLGAELGPYVEKLREERAKQRIGSNLAIVALAAWIGFTFVGGMMRGFFTNIDGVIVSATERTSPYKSLGEFLYVGPIDLFLHFFDSSKATYFNYLYRGMHEQHNNVNGYNLGEGFTSRTEFTIRGDDGHIETFKPGPACTFLSGGAAIGSRIHKEIWHWNYQLDGRVVSDIPFIGSNDNGLNGLRRVNCVIYGPVYLTIFVVILALGLLWRPAWTERVEEDLQDRQKWGWRWDD